MSTPIDNPPHSGPLPQGGEGDRGDDGIEVLEGPGWGAVGRSFRGSIPESCAEAPMMKGYNNDGKPFDVETACYLKPVYKATQDPNVRKVVCRASVQTLKTFWLESSLAYFFAREWGDIGFYLSDIEAATDHAKARYLDWLKSIPAAHDLLATAADRFDLTTTELVLPDKSMRIWPLNFSATQRITLRIVGISDARLSGRSGMIKQAIARTTQHPDDKKVLIESPGGVEGDDFDIEFRDTDQAELHVRCPLCGMGQPFEWERERPADFVACPQITQINADLDGTAGALTPALSHRMGEGESVGRVSAEGAAVSERLAGTSPTLKAMARQALAPPLPAGTPAVPGEAIVALSERLRGTFSGMKRGADAVVLLADGEYNEAAILRETFYECYYCGGGWRDVPSVRRALDDSSYYVSTAPGALACNKGFTWPKWINRRLPWGEMMLFYLKAKRANEQFGQLESLKQFWQEYAGKTWRESFATPSVKISTEAYDPTGKFPDEAKRVMIVDCQKDLETFWYIARSIDKNGDSRQLARGFARSWDEWMAVQDKLLIPNHRVLIDGRHKLSDVIQEAALRRRPMKQQIGRKVRDVWSTWNVLLGSGHGYFQWKDGQRRLFSPPTFYQASVMHNNRPLVMKIAVYNWSNLHTKDILRRYRDGDGAPKFAALIEKAESGKRESGKLSYEAQMQSEYRTREGKRDVWKEVNENDNNNHFWDCEAMGIVGMAMLGLCAFAAVPSNAPGDSTTDEHG